MVNLPPEHSEPEKKKHVVERVRPVPSIQYICYYCGWVRATSVTQHEHSLDHRLKASGLKKCGTIRVGRMVWNPDHFHYDQVRTNFERRFSVNSSFQVRSDH